MPRRHFEAADPSIVILTTPLYVFGSRLPFWQVCIVMIHFEIFGKAAALGTKTAKADDVTPLWASFYVNFSSKLANVKHHISSARHLSFIGYSLSLSLLKIYILMAYNRSRFVM